MFCTVFGGRKNKKGKNEFAVLNKQKLIYI